METLTELKNQITNELNKPVLSRDYDLIKSLQEKINLSKRWRSNRVPCKYQILSIFKISFKTAF